MPYNEKEEANFYKKVRRSIEKNNLALQPIKANDIFNINNELSFKILYIDNTEPFEPNNASIVIQLEYGTQKYLFMGDASSNVEKTLLEELSKVDILKVAHHGSNTSSSESFVNELNIKNAIFSAQKSVYGHPSEKVIEIFNNLNCKLFLTEKNGAIVF